MSLVFASGWAGFEHLYPELSKKCDYIVPFNGNWDEESIVEYLEKSKGLLLIGWSTSAHIILKHLDTTLGFEHVILVAPFLKFTAFTKDRILDIMIENFIESPNQVISAFLKKASAFYEETDFDKDAMIEGLNFLKISEAKIDKTPDNITIVHGKKDRIVPYKEAFKITKNPILLENTGHYVDEETLKRVCNEIVGKKVL